MSLTEYCHAGTIPDRTKSKTKIFFAASMMRTLTLVFL